jgi:hypothetical protein
MIRLQCPCSDTATSRDTVPGREMDDVCSKGEDQDSNRDAGDSKGKGFTTPELGSPVGDHCSFPWVFYNDRGQFEPVPQIDWQRARI